MFVYTFVSIKDIIVFTGPTVYIVLPNLSTLSAYEYKQQDKCTNLLGLNELLIFNIKST